MDFDLRHVLDDCLALLAPGFKHRPIEIKLTCESDIVCNSYPGALTQIVSNLIENAARHGLEPIGGGQIEVKVQGPSEQQNSTAGDSWLLLSVHDHGKGIPVEHLHRIFEPFFTTRLGQGGSGLGLHVVHNLALKPLGGSIKVQSAKVGGTTFVLRFPRVAPLDQL
jgi:two-component system NtrC family sensor kinase